MGHYKDPSDEKIRQKALDITKSMIVQAPAGSGKTELLIQRFLKLLSSVDKPEEVVAITFTKKAANEMQNRIMGAIANANNTREQEKNNEIATQNLAKNVLERDKHRKWRLREVPSQLRIQTIDSLCADIVKTLPLESKFGSSPKIIEDAHKYYLQAARETIIEIETNDEASSSIEELLRHLDNDLSKVEEHIAEMLSKRDQWLNYIRTENESEASNFDNALKHLIEEQLLLLKKEIPQDIASEIVELINYAADNIDDSTSNKEIKNCKDLEDLPDCKIEDVAYWKGISKLLLTNHGTLRQAIDKRFGFPPGSSTKDPQKKELMEARKEQFRVLVSKLKNHAIFVSRLSEVNYIPSEGYTDSQWIILNAFFKVLDLSVDKLRSLFRTYGVIDFTEVLHGAITGLSDVINSSDQNPSSLLGIKHILVDEFQDTSQSQNVLLEKITFGWEDKYQNTLFLVGDPMQSIYRFREAEVGLFIRAKQYGIGGIKLETLSLVDNFRSTKDIVEWVNEVFKDVLPKQDEISTGAVSFSPSVSYNSDLQSLGVTIHGFTGTNSRIEEAKRVVEIAKLQMASSPNENIAILVRSRSHLVEIVHVLKQSGIRYRAIEIEELGERPLIQDLFSLTRAINHYCDRLSWLAILRAPWCGLTLADLHYLVSGNENVPIWNLMNNKDQLAKLSDDGLQRLIRARDALSRSLQHRLRIPLRRLVEAAWVNLGGSDCIRNNGDLEDAQVFFELLEQFDEGYELVDFEGLGSAIDRLYSLGDIEADGKLQILTIHKAKGLQFDTVILPGLGRTTAADKRTMLKWLELPLTKYKENLIFAPIEDSASDKDPIYKYIEYYNTQKNSFEQARLLYVASTRAKKRLHLLGETKCKTVTEKIELVEPGKNSLLQLLWPKIHHDFEKSVTITEDQLEAVTEIQNKIIRRLKSGYILSEQKENISWRKKEPPATIESGDRASLYFNPENELSKTIGTVIHYVLENIYIEGLKNWDLVRTDQSTKQFQKILRCYGVSKSNLDSATNKVKAAIMKTLSDDRGRWILDNKWDDSHSEYPLTSYLDDEILSIKIDRTFIDDNGNRWIIDYKTSDCTDGDLNTFLDNEQEKYKDQLEKYASLMSISESGPILLGLYFPLISGWREWQYKL